MGKGEILPLVDVSAIQSVLSDHVNEPIGICRHDAVHEGEPCGLTVARIVLSPKERRAWLARGPSCENEWVEYCLTGTPEAETRKRKLGFG